MGGEQSLLLKVGSIEYAEEMSPLIVSVNILLPEKEDEADSEDTDTDKEEVVYVVEAAGPPQIPLVVRQKLASLGLGNVVIPPLDET